MEEKYNTISGQTRCQKNCTYIKKTLSMVCCRSKINGSAIHLDNAKKNYIPYQSSILMVLIFVYWINFLTIIHDYNNYNFNIEWYIAIPRYISYLINYIIIFKAYFTEDFVIQSKLVCVAWVCTVIPYIIMISNPLLYQIIGNKLFNYNSEGFITSINDKFSLDNIKLYRNSLATVIFYTFAFSYGFKKAIHNFHLTLKRMGEINAYKAIGIYIVFGEYAVNFTKKYMIFQFLSLIDFMAPFYYAMYCVFSLLSKHIFNKKLYYFGIFIRISLIIILVMRISYLLKIPELSSFFLIILPGIILICLSLIFLLFLPMYYTTAKLTELVLLILYTNILDTNHVIHQNDIELSNV